MSVWSRGDDYRKAEFRRPMFHLCDFCWSLVESSLPEVRLFVPRFHVNESQNSPFRVLFIEGKKKTRCETRYKSNDFGN